MSRKRVALSMIAIILLGGFLRFYKLGANAFDRDEFFEINSSYGYYKTGDFVAWDFNMDKPFDISLQDESSNERAEVYRWQLAQLYRFFEPSEAVTRGLSAFWGVVSIALVFFVARSFTGNIYISLIAAFLMAVGESGIIFSRRLRMYSMLLPAYLALSWTIYKFYESEYGGKIKIGRILYDKLKVNINYLPTLIVAGLVSYNVHILTASIVFTVLAYAAIMTLHSLLKKSFLNKYSLTLATGIGGFLAVRKFAPIFYGSFRKRIEFFHEKYDYFNIYFTDYVYIIVGVLLLIIGAFFLAKKLKKEKEALFLALSFLIPLLLSVYVWKREIAAHRYIYFIQSFQVIFSAIGVYAVANIFYEKTKARKKVAVIIVSIMFLAALDFSYAFSADSLYRNRENSFYPDFRRVFRYIKDNRKAEDAIITRSYRSFYWQGENMRTYDTKKLPFDRKNCAETLKSVMTESPSGWVVLPNLDAGSVCKEGKEYMKENLVKINLDPPVRFINIYRWDNNQ